MTTYPSTPAPSCVNSSRCLSRSSGGGCCSTTGAVEARGSAGRSRAGRRHRTSWRTSQPGKWPRSAADRSNPEPTRGRRSVPTGRSSTRCPPTRTSTASSRCPADGSTRPSWKVISYPGSTGSVKKTGPGSVWLSRRAQHFGSTSTVARTGPISRRVTGPENAAAFASTPFLSPLRSSSGPKKRPDWRPAIL